MFGCPKGPLGATHCGTVAYHTTQSSSGQPGIRAHICLAAHLPASCATGAPELSLTAPQVCLLTAVHAHHLFLSGGAENPTAWHRAPCVEGGVLCGYVCGGKTRLSFRPPTLYPGVPKLSWAPCLLAYCCDEGQHPTAAHAGVRRQNLASWQRAASSGSTCVASRCPKNRRGVP